MMSLGMKKLEQMIEGRMQERMRPMLEVSKEMLKELRAIKKLLQEIFVKLSE